MFKEKEIELKLRLKEVISEVSHLESVRRLIMEEFKSRNLNGIRAMWIFSGKLPLNTLEDNEEDIRLLFLFTYALNKALEQEEVDIKINVEDYFTKIECKQWEDYHEYEKESEIFPIEFKKTQKLTDKVWQTIVSAQRLSKLANDNVLIYNFKTQRNPKITASGEYINIDKGKVYEIKERLLDGEQYPDPIILNVLNDGESMIDYNENTETFTVLEGSVINIVDGFHRKTANQLAIEEFPDLDFNWQITLTFLTEKEAHDYMSQKDKQKPIKREFIQQKDYSLPENLVVDIIENDRLSELAKVMRGDDAYIRLNRALTKKSIIATAVKECYEEQLKTTHGIRNVGKWIVEFTDFLMSSYANEFIINQYKIKENNLINHKNMFYGYIALSASLQGKSDWQEKTMRKMEEFDFSIDDPLWKEIGMLSSAGKMDTKDANKGLRVRLYRLFSFMGGAENVHMG